MASSGRDNNGVFRTSIEKNLSDLCDCVKSLKIGFEETEIPVDDDNTTFHRLCEKLEYLLHAGMRENAGVFSRSRTPWHYINSCLSKLKNMNEGIRFVRGLSELKTPKGRLRSFLRFCLVHQCLADTLQQCTLCEGATSEYYSANSLFSKETWRSSFIASLYELNDIQYDLAPTGYDLDVGWPTFARKQFGSFNWSRQRSSSRLSVSLLSNSESQSVNSFRSEYTSALSSGPFNSTMTSSIQSSSPPQDPLEIDRLISTIRQLSDEKEDLQSQLESLSQQLEEERENGRRKQEQDDEEKRILKEQSTDLERRLENAHKQVSPQTVESLKQAEALGRKMLAVRDGEVELLKAQLVSTEAKVVAMKERHELQKVVIMGEVRKMANELAATEFHLKKWKELAIHWAQTVHPDDIKIDAIEELEGAVELGKKLKEMLNTQLVSSKELESVKEANISLVKALAQHGQRLSTVTNELDQTWVWLSKLKLQASQLQTDETVMRYELKEKRELLNSLKEQLEISKRQWERIRHQNVANQEEWQSIRDELDERKVTDLSSPSSKPTKETQVLLEAKVEAEREQPAFVPPIDLVSDIVPNHVTDDEMSVVESTTTDGREERLRLMEQQCRSLYSKLVNSTSRNAALVSRLASLHQHYSIKERPTTPTDQTTAQQDSVVVKVGDQERDGEQILQDKDRQLAVLKEELQAIKFDQATRQLEKEREQQAYQQQQEQLKSALDQLADNEQLIGSLQLKLSNLTGRNQEERQSLDAQFRQMELSLMTRNEECEGLVNEIRSTVADMDQLRTSHIELQEQMKSLQKAESQARADNQMLREESLMLRDKIVQLIKEKDCLWQRSDRLLHLQRIQATDQWLADGSINDCQSCQTRFTIFVRRHHCRLCGRIFCHTCSDYWLKIASSARPTRTCHECFAIHRQFSQPGGTGQLSELPITDPAEGKDLLTEPVVVQQQSDPAEPCAGFSVISDDEIVQSLNDSSPYSSPRNGINNSNIRTASLRSFDSLVNRTRTDDNPSEAFVSAGMIYRVPFQVERPGCTIHWKFRTDPKSIAFAVVGAEDENDEDSLTRIIVETTLHKSEEDFIEGHAELAIPGRYYIYFDNSYSRFSANKITFHLNLTSPSLPV